VFILWATLLYLSLSHTHTCPTALRPAVCFVYTERAEMNTHSTSLLCTLSATSGALPDAPRAISTPPAPRSRHNPTHPTLMSKANNQAQAHGKGHVRRRCRSAARLRAHTDPNLSPFSPAAVNIRCSGMCMCETVCMCACEHKCPQARVRL
jgi:hypothetical protein